MAVKKKPTMNYNAELRALRARGPGGIYLLYGPEEYLRERYLDALRALCVEPGDEFNDRRLNGQGLDLNALSEAVNALPFFGERVFVEVRDYDLSHCKESDLERLKSILTGLPDECTLVFVQGPTAEPDGRTACVKAVKKLAVALEFTEQDPAALFGWIAKRFQALGKQIGRDEAELLIFLAGTNMNRLIPEIEKASAYAAGERVTCADIEATVTRMPESYVFTITDQLAQRAYDAAAATLGDLLGNRDNHPIALTSLIGQQFRRLYAVRAALDASRGKAEAMELAGVAFEGIYNKLAAAARGYRLDQLAAIVSLCAEYDCKMKSTGLDPYQLIRELFVRIAAEARS